MRQVDEAGERPSRHASVSALRKVVDAMGPVVSRRPEWGGRPELVGQV